MSIAASTIGAAVTWLLTVLTAYGSGGVFVPFLFATGRLRLRSDGSSVCLKGLDPVPMLWLGPVLGVIPALFSSLGTFGMLGGGALALVTWFGCRVRVRVTDGRTRVVRTVAYLLPWSWRTYRSVPNAYADGWGDFADPSALYLELDGGARTIELGWGGRGTPSCDDLAANITRAIAALHDSRP